MGKCTKFSGRVFCDICFASIARPGKLVALLIQQGLHSTNKAWFPQVSAFDLMEGLSELIKGHSTVIRLAQLNSQQCPNEVQKRLS